MKTSNGWPIVKMGTIAVVKGGKRLPKGADFTNAGYPYIRARDIRNGQVTFDDPVYIDDHTRSKIKRYTVEEGDICITIVGINIGDVGIIPRSLHNANLTENAAKVTNLVGCDSAYLNVYLQSSGMKEQMQLLSSGAAQDKLGLYKIKLLDVYLPELTTQRKIAAILTAYDDLIETNKRRIALLEKMAEELYREWFVRMRFPGHQNTKFVKGVPEGWPFDLGSTFFDHVKGKSYSSPEISNEEGSCFFITLKSFHRRGGYRKEGLKYYSGSYKDDQCVQTGDVVMAVTDMTQDRAVVGEVARIPSLLGKKAVISLDVMRLIPKEMSSTFLYAYMRHSGFANYIKEFANGANVLHLKPDLVGKQRLLFPPKDLREQFSDLADPIYQEVGALEDANAVLTQTRDLLLPRLISGKLSVEALDIQFPPSMKEEATEPEPAHA
tara:strand:- start:10050 stop:11363 length:1314 start_codon:yes stop_codon:yes gene_type:complete